MSDTMVSVIVPVYNARDSIDDCIRSVLNQSCKSVELILVNDGSTDGSLKKCRIWEHDPRVTILSGENHGVSHARNLGLKKASGKWIMFLDSDDFLLDNCLDTLLAMASPDTQAVIGQYTDDEPDTAEPLYRSVSAASLRKMTLDAINNHLLPDFYEIKPLSLSACWAKLYRNQVIRENGLRFHEQLRLSEDTLFNLDYLACVTDVVVSSLPVLYYRRNTSSVTRVFKAAHLHNRFRFFDILKESREPDAAVHILSLLLYEICKIQRYTAGNHRKLLEQEVIGYLSENGDILHRVGDLSLSEGKWQRYAYRGAVICFRKGFYQAGFALLRFYAAATQGEINKLTVKE